SGTPCLRSLQRERGSGVHSAAAPRSSRLTLSGFVGARKTKRTDESAQVRGAVTWAQIRRERGCVTPSRRRRSSVVAEARIFRAEGAHRVCGGKLGLDRLDDETHEELLVFEGFGLSSIGRPAGRRAALESAHPKWARRNSQDDAQRWKRPGSRD